jgi:membrane-bound metal-dependent hydrolase YbcI (DUF457 family)
MDTITHGIVGALAGKALFAGPDVPAGVAEGGETRAISAPTARVAIVACTLGAMFPDIDIFAGPLAHNPLAIMEWHRNITHSAVLLPVWALVLAALSIPLARLVKWETPPFWRLFLVYAVALASHIFLDVITNFGTMVYSPVSYARVSWDWVFILDLTVTSIALVPQLAAWCYRDAEQFRRRAFAMWGLLTAAAVGAYFFAISAGYPFSLAVVPVVSGIFAVVIFSPASEGTGFLWTRANWCRGGLALLVAYIGLAAAMHYKAAIDVRRFAASRNLQVEKLAALALPPTLTHWEGLISTPEGVWRTTFHEPSGAIERTQLYFSARGLPLVEQAKQLRDVQTYLWFARFPVWRVIPMEGNETAVDINDVRFFREGNPFASDPGGPRRIASSRPGRAGFTFEILFDAQGKILSHGFKEPE